MAAPGRKTAQEDRAAIKAKIRVLRMAAHSMGSEAEKECSMQESASKCAEMVLGFGKGIRPGMPALPAGQNGPAIA